MVMSAADDHDLLSAADDCVESFTGKEKRSGHAGCIRLTAGVRGGGGRIGEITLSGMNVIGPQACHTHTHTQAEATNCFWITS